MPERNPIIWTLDGHDLELNHPDKVLWPADGITREDLLAYYRDIAPVMLPHLSDRPVTLRTYPEGITGPAFYKRDLPAHAPPWLRVADYTGKSTTRTIQVPLIDNAAGLAWFVNSGTIEFHGWSARAPLLNQPDQAIFDLDPGESATFAEVLQAALLVREALAQEGMLAYPKTSGRRGLHLHVPLAAGASYPEVRAWVKRVAEQLEAHHAGLVAVARGATHLGQSVTIDYAQNSIARNTASPYTVRAAPGATVAAPLTWPEVEEGAVQPGDFTLHTMRARVATHGDLLAGALRGDQRRP
ncbi:MAG: non-homologous end-joining DNA ligase [Thermomicrobiales bacterium]